VKKEGRMKKTSYFVICILVISVFVCTPSFSATIDDIVGTWDTYSQAKLKISGVGSFTDENFSETTLTLAGNFTLVEHSSGGPWSYTGTFSIIDGKKLSIAFDANGVKELIDTWKNWAQEIATDKGVTVSNINLALKA
jgi:hypothetical protein